MKFYLAVVPCFILFVPLLRSWVRAFCVLRFRFTLAGVKPTEIGVFSMWLSIRMRLLVYRRWMLSVAGSPGKRVHDTANRLRLSVFSPICGGIEVCFWGDFLQIRKMSMSRTNRNYARWSDRNGLIVTKISHIVFPVTWDATVKMEVFFLFKSCKLRAILILLRNIDQSQAKDYVTVFNDDLLVLSETSHAVITEYCVQQFEIRFKLAFFNEEKLAKLR